MSGANRPASATQPSRLRQLCRTRSRARIIRQCTMIVYNIEVLYACDLLVCKRVLSYGILRDRPSSKYLIARPVSGPSVASVLLQMRGVSVLSLKYSASYTLHRIVSSWAFCSSQQQLLHDCTDCNQIMHQTASNDVSPSPLVFCVFAVVGTLITPVQKPYTACAGCGDRRV